MHGNMGKQQQRRRKRLRLNCFGLPLLYLCTISSFLSHQHWSNGRNNVSAVEYFLQTSLTSSVKRKLENTATSQHKRTEQQIEERQDLSILISKDLVTKQANNQSTLDKELQPVAGLSCYAHGGPSNDIAKEMVYWEDIPSDSQFVSPFKVEGVTKYISFEPDEAGWNNVRMAVETIVVMAIVTGRTLVLPPQQGLWMLTQTDGAEGGEQRSKFSLTDFFHLERVAMEHAGLDIITMQDFLQREALSGHIRDQNGSVSFPPGNRTNWDGANVRELNLWLRNILYRPLWEPESCVLAIPSSTGSQEVQNLRSMFSKVKQEEGFPPYQTFVGKPNPVDAPAIARLKENWAEQSNGGKAMCVYDEEKQNAKVLHFAYDKRNPKARMLVHFYAFLFFQDWHQDLWAKRFVRDHLRYTDEIQCIAARIVHAIRERSRARGNPDGTFESFHVRRGDFGDLTNLTQIDAAGILKISKQELAENATIYIASDETDRAFFNAFKERYDVVFLEDFKDLLGSVNTNFFGMIEQLVASRGRVFFGCFYSTFTGYINRLRGYHANKVKAPGYEDGIIDSWYYAPASQRDQMRSFYPVYQGYFYREFPTSWRLINKGVNEVTE